MCVVLVVISKQTKYFPCCGFPSSPDMEALEAQKKEKEAAAAAAAANPSTTAATSTTPGLPSYAPDYAAGLIAPATPVRNWDGMFVCIANDNSHMIEITMK